MVCYFPDLLDDFGSSRCTDLGSTLAYPHVTIIIILIGQGIGKDLLKRCIL